MSLPSSKEQNPPGTPEGPDLQDVRRRDPLPGRRGADT